MKTFDQIINFENTNIYNGFDLDNTFFFDIETTGLSPKNSMIYLIGIMYFDKEWHLKQWILDNAADEENMLIDFTQLITSKCFKNVVHFNGTTFDCKFVDDHCSVYGIKFSFAEFTQIDLYKVYTKYKSILSLENLKQKSIEFSYGINRKDKLSGKELIKLYKEYLLNKKTDNEELLLLHNFEDIVNLPVLSNVMALDDLFKSNFEISSFNISENSEHGEATISLSNLLPPFVNISNYYNIEYLDQIKSSEGDSYKYRMIFGEVKKETLKFFYEDYKNYYYLPNEDMAVHKSMAEFIDKNKKVKANKTNCYTKVTGEYISIMEKPLISKKYNEADLDCFKDIKIFKDDDGNSFIRISEFENKEFIRKYINYILK